MERLYILVRNDLKPGLQIAQACHAQRQFAEDHPLLDRAWHASGGNLVVVQVESEDALTAWATALVARGIPIACFREPDLGDALTAIAVAGNAKKLLRALPLALVA